MSDPVAEAAAQIAAQAAAQAEPTMLERAMETIHDLEAKVEHLIHPDAPGNAPVAAEASVTAPATADSGNVPAATSQSVPAEAAAAPTPSAASDAPQPAADLPNADAGTQPAGAATDAAGDSPNGASVAVEPTTALGSASNAAGANITSTTAASSDEPPLHARIAEHLEAIYTLARDHSIATETAATRAAAATKTHVGDILHRISNGMAVSEGELVAKLEALYRML
jgi:hypothetical protein